MRALQGGEEGKKEHGQCIGQNRLSVRIRCDKIEGMFRHSAQKHVPEHAIHVATALTEDLSMAVEKSNIGLDTRGTAMTQ